MSAQETKTELQETKIYYEVGVVGCIRNKNYQKDRKIFLLLCFLESIGIRNEVRIVYQKSTSKIDNCDNAARSGTIGKS